MKASLQTRINGSELSAWVLGLSLCLLPFGPALPSSLMALFLLIQLIGWQFASLSRWEKLFITLWLIYIGFHLVGMIGVEEPGRGWKLISRRASLFLIVIAFFSRYTDLYRHLSKIGWLLVAGIGLYMLLLHLSVVVDLFSRQADLLDFFSYDRDQMRAVSFVQPARNEIYLGLLINLAILFVLYQVSQHRLSWLSWLLLAYFMFCLWLNAARMAQILGLLTVALFCLESLRNRYAWSLKRTLLISLILLAVPLTLLAFFRVDFVHALEERFIDLPRNHPTLRLAEALEHGDTARVENWSSALIVLQDHPLGVGTNQARSYLQAARDTTSIAYKIRANAHNQYLEEALQFGWIGLVIFVSGWTLIVWMGGISGGKLWIGLGAILMISMLTESILFRNMGIILATAYAYLCIVNYRCR